MLPLSCCAFLWPRRGAQAVHRCPACQVLRMLAAVIAAAAAFLLGCPYALSLGDGLGLNPEFARGFRFELEHMRAGGTFAFVASGSGWGYHFFQGLPAGLGLPLMGLALLGLLLLVGRGRRAGLVVLWCALYFLTIGFARERFLRYLLPLTPFLAVAAAQAGLTLWQAWRPRWLWRAAAAAALGLTACYSVGQLSLLVMQDPRDRAADWIDSRRPRPSRIGLAQTPWFFTPPVTPYNGGSRTAKLFRKWNEERGKPIAVIGWNAARLRRVRPDLFLLTDLEYRDLVRLGSHDVAELWDELEARYLRRDFSAPAVFSWVGLGKWHAPPDWQYAWPTVSVYYSPRGW